MSESVNSWKSEKLKNCTKQSLTLLQKLQIYPPNRPGWRTVRENRSQNPRRWNQEGSSFSYNPHRPGPGAAAPASATRTTHSGTLGRKTPPSEQKSPPWLRRTTSAAVWSLNWPSQQCSEPQRGKRKRRILLMLACLWLPVTYVCPSGSFEAN